MNIPLMSAVCANDKAVLIKHSYISLWLVSHCSSLSYAVSHCYVGEGGLLRSCNNFVLSEYWFVISANERNKKSSSFLIISSLSIYVSSPSKTTMLLSKFSSPLTARKTCYEMVADIVHIIQSSWVAWPLSRMMVAVWCWYELKSTSALFIDLFG